jgi:hypothetical protein
MTTEKDQDLLTSGSIAKELGVPDAKVKKTINELAIRPKAKKGHRNYYSSDVLTRIKGALR